jgi:hypothetical protein
MHSLDKRRGCGFVTQHLTQFENTNRRHRVANGDVRPNGVEQRFLGHQITGMIDQILQNIERLAPQAYRLIASPKLGVQKIEAEWREKAVRLVEHVPSK